MAWLDRHSRRLHPGAVSNLIEFCARPSDRLIRSGELLGLQWQDLDFQHRRVRISRTLWRGKIQTTKTEASNRIVGMPDQLAEILLEHRATTKFTAPDDFVFCQEDGRPFDPDSLRRYGIYPALERAGIPIRKRASGCHAFRHLTGSLIHRKTGSLKLAQQQLGHSNVSTTANIYTHVEEQEMKESAKILGKAICARSVVDGDSDRGHVN